MASPMRPVGHDSSAIMVSCYVHIVWIHYERWSIQLGKSFKRFRVAAFQRILPSIYAGGMVTSKTLLAPNLIGHFHDACELSLN